MKTLSLSDAKARLSSLVDAVERNDQEVVITRNGRPAAVLVSHDEFESWQETYAVRSDAGLRAEVKKGLRAMRSRGAKLYTLAELFD